MRLAYNQPPDFFFSLSPEFFSDLWYKSEKKIMWQTEKKFRRSGTEIFLRFEADLKFSRPSFSEIKVQIKWLNIISTQLDRKSDTEGQSKILPDMNLFSVHSIETPAATLYQFYSSQAFIFTNYLHRVHQTKKLFISYRPVSTNLRSTIPFLIQQY